MESKSMSDFDQLLDQALAEFAASQGTITPEKQADYNRYANFLQEISDEDEDLAKTEISTVSSIEEDRLEGEANELLDELRDNPNSWFNKSTWVVNDKGQFVRRDDGELFDTGEDIVSVSDTPIKAEEELTELEKKQRRAEKLVKGAAKYKHNRDLRKIEINRMLPLSGLGFLYRILDFCTKPVRTSVRLRHSG